MPPRSVAANSQPALPGSALVGVRMVTRWNDASHYTSQLDCIFRGLLRPPANRHRRPSPVTANQRTDIRLLSPKVTLTLMSKPPAGFPNIDRFIPLYDTPPRSRITSEAHQKSPLRCLKSLAVKGTNIRQTTTSFDISRPSTYTAIDQR